MKGYLTNVDTAEEFFRRCMERKAETREERIKILEELRKELRAVKLNDIDMKRQLKGKRILRINKNDSL